MTDNAVYHDRQWEVPKICALTSVFLVCSFLLDRRKIMLGSLFV